MLDAFNTRTHFGAFLFRQNYFRPNGLVGFVTEKQVLDGYVDASGNEKTIRDTVLTVGGCLSTPEKWGAFHSEWQAFLKREGFRLEPKFGQYVYHTTDVMACRDDKDLIPINLTREKARRIHREAVGIVCKHTIYRFGFGVLLDHMRNFEMKYPHSKELVFAKAGTFMSGLCFQKNQTWAELNGFDPWISYINDQNDEFWGNLDSGYRFARKELPREERTIDKLDFEDKREFSPLQAADVVVWECSTYFKRVKRIHLVLRKSPGLYMRPEMKMISETRSEARFWLYYDKSLADELEFYMRPILNDVLDGKPEADYIGEGKQWESIEAFAKYTLDVIKQGKVEKARAAQAERKIKQNEKKNDPGI